MNEEKSVSTSKIRSTSVFLWNKNTVVPDLSKPLLYYHEYVDAQQKRDFELTGENIRRDRENYQKAYSSYCSKYRKLIEESK